MADADISIQVLVHTNTGTLTIQDNPDIGPDLIQLSYQDHPHLGGSKPVIMSFTPKELVVVIDALSKKLELSEPQPRGVFEQNYGNK